MHWHTQGGPRGHVPPGVKKKREREGGGERGKREGERGAGRTKKEAEK